MYGLDSGAMTKRWTLSSVWDCRLSMQPSKNNRKSPWPRALFFEVAGENLAWALVCWPSSNNFLTLVLIFSGIAPRRTQTQEVLVVWKLTLLFTNSTNFSHFILGQSATNINIAKIIFKHVVLIPKN